MTTVLVGAAAYRIYVEKTNRRNGMTASTETAAPTSGKTIPVNIEVVTTPVTETSRKLFEQASTGVQWYLEQWEDLLIEASHMALGRNVQFTTADVLADLPHAKVVSNSPGRVRLRLKELRWQEDLLSQSVQALGSVPGIKQVEGSVVTGSILIHYDRTQYTTLDALLAALAGS